MSNAFFQRHVSSLVLSGAVVLAVLALWNMTRLAWLFMPGGGHAPASPSLMTTGAEPADAERILASGIFGRDRGDAPATSLALSLKGIYATADRHGYAIIATPQGEARVYAVGDELPGGVRVAAIERRAVILATVRGNESLPLLEPAPGAGVTAAPAVPTQPRQQAATRSAGTTDGTTGFRVPATGLAAPLAGLGLRPGDVVVAVDGHPVPASGLDAGAFAALVPGSPLVLDIERDGRPVSLHARVPLSGGIRRYP